MQYVGRLVSTVYNSITPSINPATLSGAIDVIVVEREIEEEVDDEDDEDDEGEEQRQQAGSAQGAQQAAQGSGNKDKKRKKRLTTELASSPFHVRFGKMSVLRPAERKVTLHLNNSPEPLPFAMKVGEAGEAFFVLEIDDEEARAGVPDDLVTSPILSAASSPANSPPGANQGDAPKGDVEPLDLGAAEGDGEGVGDDDDDDDDEGELEQDLDAKSATNTDRTTGTSITTPSAGPCPSGEAPSSQKGASKEPEDEPLPSVRRDEDGNEPGDLDVPNDSGPSGSGPVGPSSILGQVENAASRAGGALGAAGKAVVGVAGLGGDRKLESVARKQRRKDRHADREHGSAPDDSDSETEQGSKWQSQESSDGAQRLEKEDQRAPAPGEKQETEMDHLEKEMRGRVVDLINASEEAQNRAPESERAASSAKTHSSDWTRSLSQELETKSSSDTAAAPREHNRARSTSSSHSRRQSHVEDHEEAYPAPFGVGTPGPTGRTSLDFTSGSGIEDLRGEPDGSKGRFDCQSTATGTETYPVAQSTHSEFLDGKKLKPMKTGIEDALIAPAVVDPRYVKNSVRKQSEGGTTGDKSKSIKEGEESARRGASGDQRHLAANAAADLEDGYGERERAGREKKQKGRVSGLKAEEEGERGRGKVVRQDSVKDEEIAAPTSAKKEDLAYMLDMDGYKMTADGEDIALAEGQRLQDEMPLSRRHGGKGRHGHGERMDHVFKHSHSGSYSSAQSRRSVSRPRGRESLERNEWASHKRLGSEASTLRTRRGHHEAEDEEDEEQGAHHRSGSSTPSSILGFPARRHTPPPSNGGAGSTSAAQRARRCDQDELSLSRDLVRAARLAGGMTSSAFLGRTTGRGMHGMREHLVESPLGHPRRRRASLAHGVSAASPASSGVAARHRLALDDVRRIHRSGIDPTSGPGARGRRGHGHYQEVSLSDTEAEVSSPRTPRGIRAAHAQEGAETPPDGPSGEVEGETSDHLGRSPPEYEWGWGKFPVPARSDERDAAQRHANNTAASRRARVTSSGATDGVGEGASASSSAPASAAAAASPSAILRSRDERSQADAAQEPPKGRLMSAQEDPYIFRLELDEGRTVHEFQLSLCYKEGWGKDKDADEYNFEENRVSFQRFVDDADVVNDERLVVCYHERFLTWENASAVLATLSLYRKTLSAPLSGVDGSSGRDGRDPNDRGSGEGAEADRSASRGSVWSRWWNRSKSSYDLQAQAHAQDKAERDGERQGGDTGVGRKESDDALAAAAAAGAGMPPRELGRSATDSILDAQHAQEAEAAVREQQETAAAAAEAKRQWDDGRPKKTYAKTLRLTSDQLKSLNLKKGANTITFSVTSSYSGVATCTARIFLWESSHQVVVSDIDGTITKSDALGHVFTMIGRDWTHLGVAKLYTDIARNGYRIMYLTSRAIGQADTTRDYLKGIKQNNYQLPDGPVIMSPDRLMASLHREVILRKPEVFKMACLRDIARLFGTDPRTQPQTQPQPFQPPSQQPGNPSLGPTPAPGGNPNPFYAGFGNRITDALSYRSVNIPSSRIFTIDSNGEVKMELLELAGYKSSYIHMTDLVDQMFPPITARHERNPRNPEFNDFNFWRASMPDIELPPDDELIPTPPVSPALSARSGRSVRSDTSARSGRSGSTAGAGYEGEVEKPGRLSRFGLGSLGLSRRGSAATVPATDEKRAATVPHGGLPESSSAPDLQEAAARDPPLRANSDLPTTTAGGEASSPSSEYGYGSGVTRWASSWAGRRAASPGGGTRPTSPLVGPVITAEPESDEEAEDSGAGSDDDVSSFGGRSRRMSSEEPGEFGEEEEEEEEGQDEEEEYAQGEDGDVPEMGDDVLDDDVLATGEIRFEWRG